MVWCLKGVCFRRTVVINDPQKSKKSTQVIGKRLTISHLEFEPRPPIHGSFNGIVPSSQKNGFMTPASEPEKSPQQRAAETSATKEKPTSSNAFKKSRTSAPKPPEQVIGNGEKASENSEIKTEISVSKGAVVDTKIYQSSETSTEQITQNEQLLDTTEISISEGTVLDLNDISSKNSSQQTAVGKERLSESSLLEITEPSVSKEEKSSSKISQDSAAQVTIRGGRLSENSLLDPLEQRRRSGITAVRTDLNENEKLPNFIKDPEDAGLIRKAIEDNDFLSKIISEKRMDDVISAMYNKEISPGEIIIKQGDKGSHMYVSAKGRFQILIKGKVIQEFEDVRVFGELAILYNAKRLATVKTVTSGRVWVLDSSVYQKIVVRHHIREQDETMNFLLNNQILNVVGREALQVVSNLLKSEFYPTGKEIVRQGDKGNKFFIIRAGEVTITKEKEGVVGVYRKGDCFGELALLQDERRQATVTANPPGVECLTLSREQFINHLGVIQNFSYISMETKDSIKPVESGYAELDIMDLKLCKTLGVGGFGRVELVQHTKERDLVFAVKYLKKVEIVAQGQQEHVYNERNIQMACNSPFIVRLHRSYKDEKYIYFLMESCLGGDLWSLLQKQQNRRFEETDAKFICGCVLESFDYLHSRGIIYRDLKPENLLIAADGYIKLTDFGFAKRLPAHGKTFTFAGTPEYVAPEIVLNRGHDKAVDYWAFGVFIFEMLTGRTPFRTDDSSHMRTYNKILSGIDNVRFPTYVTVKARNLIEKLCRPVPSERLAMSRGGIQDIRKHKWYSGFEWNALAKREMMAPFRPQLSGPLDTRYFDEFKKDTYRPPDELSGWDEAL